MVSKNPATDKFINMLFPGGTDGINEVAKKIQKDFPNLLTVEDCYHIYTYFKSFCFFYRVNTDDVKGNIDYLVKSIGRNLGKELTREENRAILQSLMNNDMVIYTKMTNAGIYSQEEKELWDSDDDGDDFGLSIDNPIKTAGISYSDLYLSRLRTIDGRKISFERVEGKPNKNLGNSFTLQEWNKAQISHGLPKGNLTRIVDMYWIYNEEGKKINTIYICPYFSDNSRKAPKGLIYLGGEEGNEINTDTDADVNVDENSDVNADINADINVENANDKILNTKPILNINLRKFKRIKNPFAKVREIAEKNNNSKLKGQLGEITGTPPNIPDGDLTEKNTSRFIEKNTCRMVNTIVAMDIDDNLKYSCFLELKDRLLNSYAKTIAQLLVKCKDLGLTDRELYQGMVQDVLNIKRANEKVFKKCEEELVGTGLEYTSKGGYSYKGLITTGFITAIVFATLAGGFSLFSMLTLIVDKSITGIIITILIFAIFAIFTAIIGFKRKNKTLSVFSIIMSSIFFIEWLGVFPRGIIFSIIFAIPFLCGTVGIFKYNITEGKVRLGTLGTILLMGDILISLIVIIMHLYITSG